MKASTQPVKTTSPTSDATQLASKSAQAIVDNRPQAVAQRKLQEAINNSPQQVAQRQTVEAINNSPRQVAQQQAAAQLQARPNRTGLPNKLKAGVENLSGHSLDDVKVHYNSAKPAQLQAHAYAQGAEIHLAPGQEKHLPHEAWHVVQQKQGQVRATTQLKGVGVNDDSSLEREADVMGGRAMGGSDVADKNSAISKTPSSGPIQMIKSSKDSGKYGMSSMSGKAAEFRKNSKIPPALNVGTFFFVRDNLPQSSTASSLGIAFRDEASGKKTNHGHSENQLFMKMKDYGWPDKLAIRQVYTERKECSDKIASYFNGRLLTGCGTLLRAIDNHQREAGEPELSVSHSFDGSEQQIRQQIRFAMMEYRHDMTEKQRSEQLERDMTDELDEVRKGCVKQLDKIREEKMKDLRLRNQRKERVEVRHESVFGGEGNDDYSDSDYGNEEDVMDEDENAYVNYDDMDYSDSEETGNSIENLVDELNNFYEIIIREMADEFDEILSDYMADMTSKEAPQIPAVQLDGGSNMLGMPNSNNNSSATTISNKKFNPSDAEIFNRYVGNYHKLFSDKIELFEQLEQ